ncbi:putative bifunctional UDP-N-acetylglucosamine transferase and deubiquitinase ALG13 isoform X1 [Anthonomus grandis grandis]|nr:putative bifunctional UDP-N-acetylglucosamine transferase and deubiquitinase ALG13 isoform X1 [Anthonomus grandis grandis]
MTMHGLARKSRNHGFVDTWLENLGYYRKNVAYDETCMFRTVSEQLFNSQVFHEKVRKECIEYGREHFDEFRHLGKTESEWNDHLNNLELHMAVCGNLEIHLISKKYKKDVFVCLPNQQIHDITCQHYPGDPIMLCLVDGDHYDAVYKKEHIVNLGFCQSIIYKILYENVFEIPNVDRIVKAMLYEKTPVVNITELEEKRAVGGKEFTTEELENAIVAPFPFKVAKALDPLIYRNIEYDSWGDVRREFRLGDWYYGDDKLKLGTRCIFTEPNTYEKFDCYIQELHKDKDKCVVYLTKCVEKRVVHYSELSPEANAKPWPLPYRFAKNQSSSGEILQIAPIDKVRSTRKKRKENKVQSKSTNDLSSISNDVRVMPYVGTPLLISSNNNTVTEKTDSTTETTVSLPQAEGLLTPNTPDMYQYPRYSWEAYHWQTPQYVHDSHYYQHSHEQFVWPQPGHCSSASPPYYDFKPMVASAPVTPNVIPYHEPRPFYYNCQMEPTASNQPPVVTQSDQEIKDSEAEQGVSSLPTQQATRDHLVLPQGGAYNSTTVVPASHMQNASYMPHVVQQPIEVYNGPPVSPMIYTPVHVAPPTSQEGGGVVPTSPVIYAPSAPLDVQWFHSPGYHSPGCRPYNPTGFIFPTQK